MKWKLAKYTCMDNECGFKQTDHKTPDARRCPKCRFYMEMELVKK